MVINAKQVALPKEGAMIFSSTLNMLAQTIAALMIFVVGYLALLLSAIILLVTAVLLCKSARLLWSYVMRTLAPAGF